MLVPSPKVPTYDLQPEMSAAGVADALVASVSHHKHDVIICNFANPDMVGHTGMLAGGHRRGQGRGRLPRRGASTALLAAGGTAIVTADHGNCEQMWDYELNAPHTAHTTNLVPVHLRAGPGRGDPARRCRDGALSDVAPTLLQPPRPAARRRR